MKRIFIISMTTLLLFCLIIRTETVTQGVNDALLLCVRAAIPTLLPFFVLSGIMVNTGTVSLIGKIISPVAGLIFGISGKGAVAFLIGLLCGYPTGAKVIADMYKNNGISKREAESLLAFCNNSGPLFVIGALGTKMLGNHTSGIILYAIHALSAVVCAVVFGLFSRRKNEKGKEEIVTIKLGEAVSKSVEQAVLSILNVCGYVVFFACITTLIKQYITEPFILSLIEVTAGAKELSECNVPMEMKMVLISGAVGFGGVCVLFQVMSAVSGVGLSVKKYIAGKTFQAVVAMCTAWIFLSFFDNVPVFAPITATHKIFQVSYILTFMFLMCGIFTLRRLTRKERCAKIKLNDF